MKTFLLLTGILCMASVSHAAPIAGPAIPPDPNAIKSDPDVDALMASTFKGGVSIPRKIADSYTDRVQALINALETSKDDSVLGEQRKEALIYVLGELRAANATKALVANLTFIPKQPLPEITGYREPQEDFRSAVALVRIGTPAVEPLIGLIATSESPDERNLAAWVLIKIDGPQVALFRLQTARAGRQGSPAVRLDEACQYIFSRKPLKEEAWKQP